MNGIGLITTSNQATQLSGLTVFIYCFFVSSVKTSGNELISDFDINEAKHKFSSYDPIEVGEAVRELRKNKLIKIDEGTIIVGSFVEKTRKLFNGNEISLSAETSLIRQYSEEYLNATKTGIRFSLAEKACNDILKLLQDIDIFTSKEFIKLFSLAYEIFTQEKHREFLDKEYGQMKNFIKLYDGVTATKLVLNFIFNHNKWCKHPSIGNLLYFKDDIFEFTMKKNKKVGMREVEKTELYEGGF